MTFWPASRSWIALSKEIASPWILSVIGSSARVSGSSCASTVVVPISKPESKAPRRLDRQLGDFGTDSVIRAGRLLVIDDAMDLRLSAGLSIAMKLPGTMDP